MFIPPFGRSDIRGRFLPLFLFFGEKFGEKLFSTKQNKTTDKKGERLKTSHFQRLQPNKTIQNNTYVTSGIRFDSPHPLHERKEAIGLFFVPIAKGIEPERTGAVSGAVHMRVFLIEAIFGKIIMTPKQDEGERS